MVAAIPLDPLPESPAGSLLRLCADILYELPINCDASLEAIEIKRKLLLGEKLDADEFHFADAKARAALAYIQRRTLDGVITGARTKARGVGADIYRWMWFAVIADAGIQSEGVDFHCSDANMEDSTTQCVFEFPPNKDTILRRAEATAEIACFIALATAIATSYKPHWIDVVRLLEKALRWSEYESWGAGGNWRDYQNEQLLEICGALEEFKIYQPLPPRREVTDYTPTDIAAKTRSLIRNEYHNRIADVADLSGAAAGISNQIATWMYYRAIFGPKSNVGHYARQFWDYPAGAPHIPGKIQHFLIDDDEIRWRSEAWSRYQDGAAKWKKITTPVKHKLLCCTYCEDSFRGRQSRDHDTGYGTCPKCRKWIKPSDDDDDGWHEGYCAMRALQKQWDLFHLYDTKHGRESRDKPPSSGPIGDRYKILKKEVFELRGKFVHLVDNEDTRLAHLPHEIIEYEEDDATERKPFIKYPLSPLRPINEYGFTPTDNKRWNPKFKALYESASGDKQDQQWRGAPQKEDGVLDMRSNEGKAFVESQALSLEEADFGSDGAGLANYDSD